MGGVLERYPAIASVSLNNAAYWRVKQPSQTFHGRDIFAPVGAHLANGVPLAAVGEPTALESLFDIVLPKLRKTTQKVIGSIQYIDHFGNLITNIPEEMLADIAYDICLGNHQIQLVRTYAEVSVGELAALIGSHGLLEIMVNQGSAQQRLSASVGSEVELNPRKTI